MNNKKPKSFFFSLLQKLNSKASDFVKMKALAYWLNNNIKLVYESENYLVFWVYPLDGYNKNIRQVEFFPPLGKFMCHRRTKSGTKTDCDGYRKFGFCSHILASIYYYLKTTGIKGTEYFYLKDKALKWIEQWKKKAKKK